MSRKEFLSVKKKYTTGTLFLTAEQGQQTDEDVNDVEVDVEGAVDGVVDSLGIDLGLGALRTLKIIRLDSPAIFSDR